MQYSQYKRIMSAVYANDQTSTVLNEFVSAFNELSPTHQKTLSLKYDQELTMIKIAGQMNISVNKVSQLIHEGKAQLRRKVNPQYYLEAIERYAKIEEA